MNLVKLLTVSLLFTFSLASHAASFTPKFNEYSFPGSQFTVDGAANAFYSTNYGITIENSYLYKDSRDSFDGVGIANGAVSEIGTLQTGRINFLDTTDFVTVEYWALQSTVYEAYTSDGTFIDSFTFRSGQGTINFSGGIISYLIFSGVGGYSTISGLTYNYDGVTDGRNDDLPSVPVPASAFLFAPALLGMVAFRRKGKA